MGYTTKLSDYEMDRAWTHVPAPEGVDIEAERENDEPKKTSGKSQTKKDAPTGTTRSKVVEAEKKSPAKKSTARTKSK